MPWQLSNFSTAICRLSVHELLKGCLHCHQNVCTVSYEWMKAIVTLTWVSCSERHVTCELDPVLRHRNFRCWSQWPRGMKRGSSGRSLARDCGFESLLVHGCLSLVGVVCYQISLCDGPVTRPEESCCVCCVVECDLETWHRAVCTTICCKAGLIGCTAVVPAVLVVLVPPADIWYAGICCWTFVDSPLPSVVILRQAELISEVINSCVHVVIGRAEAPSKGVWGSHSGDCRMWDLTPCSLVQLL
jgi:hypothetical protein